MKKSLILASLLAFTMASAIAAEQTTNCPCEKCPPRPPMEQGKFQPPSADGKFQPPPPPKGERPDNKKADFEKKLKLTDEQKAQAKAIRQKGHEEMKPIFEKMKAKKTEAKAIRENTALSEEQKSQQLGQIRKEMKALHKEARDLRFKNMQEFESILTDKQKKTLEKMKEEGKKKFQKEHKRHPAPFGPAKGKCQCGCDKAK